jgi:hypothetical protein
MRIQKTSGFRIERNEARIARKLGHSGRRKREGFPYGGRRGHRDGLLGVRSARPAGPSGYARCASSRAQVIAPLRPGSTPAKARRAARSRQRFESARERGKKPRAGGKGWAGPPFEAANARKPSDRATRLPSRAWRVADRLAPFWRPAPRHRRGSPAPPPALCALAPFDAAFSKTRAPLPPSTHALFCRQGFQIEPRPATRPDAPRERETGAPGSLVPPRVNGPKPPARAFGGLFTGFRVGNLVPTWCRHGAKIA